MLSVISSVLFAQQSTSMPKVPGRSAFYVEFGGPGILFSANYDTRFAKSSLGWGARAGLGFVTGDELREVNGNFEYEQRSVVTIPVQVNYVFGKTSSPHTFEVGAGVTYVGKELELLDFNDDRSTQVLGTASFMYRRQPHDGGFTWRIGFTPLIASGFIQAFAGVGIGYSF